MEIGTVDILEEKPGSKRRRSGFTGGPGQGGPGGRNPGGGGDRPNGDDPESSSNEELNRDRSRILTGFLLVIVTMTFGGLIAAYIVIATNNVLEWHPFALPIQVWISTAVILASSVTYHLAKKALMLNDHPAAKKWLVVTTVLGAAFISSQILAWLALTARGLYMSGNPYAGFFYILTAVHAVHVLGGITALGAVMLRSWLPTDNPHALESRRTLAQVVGWYWHFMDGLWILLFILLGFWK